jgi:hypothetical protein
LVLGCVQLDAQEPFWHTSPVGQALPQPPQLAGSLSGSTHALPHFTKPGRQTKSQVPELHWAAPLVGTSQALPQLPQLAASVSKSMQAPPQAS